MAHQGSIDEKHHSFPRGSLPTQYSRSVTRRRCLVLAIVLLSILYFSNIIFAPALRPWRHNTIYATNAKSNQLDTMTLDQAQLSKSRRKVSLEAHIMSKCPDAKDCLRDLVVPSMELIVDLVDFQLSFIGEYVPYVYFRSAFIYQLYRTRYSHENS